MAKVDFSSEVVTRECAVEAALMAGQSGQGRDLRDLLRNGLGKSSQAALTTALQLLEVDGVGATLVLRIPERSTEKVEAQCTVGRVHVVLDQPR